MISKLKSQEPKHQMISEQLRWSRPMSPLIQWSIDSSSEDRVPPSKGLFSTCCKNNGFWYSLGPLTSVEYTLTLCQKQWSRCRGKRKSY